MYQLEHPLGPKLHLLQERRVSVVADQAPVTQLVDMLDLGKALHPPPDAIFFSPWNPRWSRRACHCHANFCPCMSKQIGCAMVALSTNNRFATCGILAIIRSSTSLIQMVLNLMLELANAENIGLELGDEIDAGGAILAALGAEDDGLASLDAYH
jgi:hypothetical protein